MWLLLCLAREGGFSQWFPSYFQAIANLWCDPEKDASSPLGLDFFSKHCQCSVALNIPWKYCNLIYLLFLCTKVSQP